MPGSLTLRNLDDEVIARLERRAARNGHSTETEVSAILRQAVAAEAESDFDRLAAEFRARTADRPHTPSEILLRESRDER